MKKALVLFSGGVDSTTCLALAIHRYGKENVVALSVSYGQKHSRELAAAVLIVDHYQVEHLQLDLSAMFAHSDCSLLQHADQDIPQASYEEQLRQTNGSPVSTYVPFRNGLFLAAAASVALSKKCEVIFYGAHCDDAAGNAYPDCSEVFHEAMDTAIYEGSGRQLLIEAPFVKCSKKEVVRQGVELGVPYELTWSCYEGSTVPCGVCGTCIDRKTAFAENGLLLSEQIQNRKT